MSEALQQRTRCSRRLRGRAPSSPSPPSQLRLNLGTITMDAFRQLNDHCRVNVDRSECVYPKRRKVEEGKGGDNDEIVDEERVVLDDAQAATESSIPSTPPPKASPPPTPPKDELTLIADILEEVKQIEKKVDNFKGSAARGEKEYRILDGRLTICVDRLDKVESKGREDVRSSRKECIRYTQSCIDKLEEKKMLVVPSTMEEAVTP